MYTKLISDKSDVKCTWIRAEQTLCEMVVWSFTNKHLPCRKRANVPDYEKHLSHRWDNLQTRYKSPTDPLRKRIDRIKTLFKSKFTSAEQTLYEMEVWSSTNEYLPRQGGAKVSDYEKNLALKWNKVQRHKSPDDPLCERINKIKTLFKSKFTSAKQTLCEMVVWSFTNKYSPCLGANVSDYEKKLAERWGSVQSGHKSPTDPLRERIDRIKTLFKSKFTSAEQTLCEMEAWSFTNEYLPRKKGADVSDYEKKLMERWGGVQSGHKSPTDPLRERIDKINFLFKRRYNNANHTNRQPGTVFPDTRKPTGEECADGLSDMCRIIDHPSPAKRGIVFLRGGRLVDLTDHTNIHNFPQFAPDNSPGSEHIETPAPSVSRSDIEHGLYVFTCRLYADLAGMTDFDKPSSYKNKTYPDPQKINENPDLHTLVEAEDPLLRLVEIPLFTTEEKDALLSAYDAACAEVANAEELADDPQNWPRCVELTALYDRLTLKYNTAIFNAYLRILKDRSAELDELLQYINGRIQTNRLAGANVWTAAEQVGRIYFWLELIRNGVLDSEENYAEYYKQYRRERIQDNTELSMANIHRLIRDNLPNRRERVIKLIRHGLLALGYEARNFRKRLRHAVEQLAIAKADSGQNANFATDDMTSSVVGQ
jgi:hypothetical protein